MNDVITLQDVSYTYDPDTPTAFTALQGINLTVHYGEILGVIGHTGTGKSTLLRLLGGLTSPTSGTRTYTEAIAGQKDKPRPGRVGLVFQYPEDQLFEETVADDVAFGPRQVGATEEEIAARTEESLRFVDLDPDTFGPRSPFELSGGQKRRVAIAGVLALDPAVLIFDEPTSGLDPMSKWKFLETIRQLNDRGRTILVVSHDLEALAAIAHRIIVLDQGRIAFSGTPREVFSRVADLRALRIGSFIISEVLYDLASAGLPVDRSALTLDEFASTLAEARGKTGDRRQETGVKKEKETES